MRISFMSPVLVVLGVSVLVAQGPAPSRTPYGRIAVTSQNVLALREWDTNVDSRLRSGELGLDFYGLRAKLTELGVRYLDEPEHT